MRLGRASLGLVTGMTLLTSVAVAQESGRLPIIARGELRQEIKSTPILERPNRPLHFYGNTVRRLSGQAAQRNGSYTPQR